MDILPLLLAQAAPAPVSPLRQWLPLIGMVVVFYLVLILPRQREVKRHQQMLSALEKGDTVVTSGGLIGEIMALRENQVTLRSGSSTVLVERQRIARRMSAKTEAK